MSSQLPDLDEDVSFVVDAGEASGPMAMRTIIDSIRSGERAPDVLVWWAGAAEWAPFAADEGLFGLLQDLPATNQPPPPLVANESANEAAEADESIVDDSQVVEEQVQDSAVEDLLSADLLDEDTPDTESNPYDTLASELDAIRADFELDPDEAVVTQLEDVVAEDVQSDLPMAEEPSTDIEDQVAELLARGPRDLHPSAGWGVVDDEKLLDSDVGELAGEIASVDDESYVEAIKAAEVFAIEPTPEVEAEPGTDEDRSLTGLFGATARVESGLREASPDTPTIEPIDSVRASLANVGARIEALTSAARHSRLAEPAEPVNIGTPVLPESTEFTDGSEPLSQVAADDGEPDPPGSWQSVDAEIADDEPAGDSGLDERFAEMVKKSLLHQRRIDWASRVDELLLSACITSVIDKGFVVSDLSSNDSDHRVLFEHNDDSRSVRLELSPLSPINSAGDPIGRHVRIGLAWGRSVVDAGEAFTMVQSQAIEGEVLPGVITSEAAVASSTASTAVELIWAADDFVSDDHSVDRLALDECVAAGLHALEVQWHKLFVAEG